MSFEIFLLSFGLALDAMWVSIGMGLAHSHKLASTHQWLRSLTLGTTFGIFQFLMIYVGALGGEKVAFSRYGQVVNLAVAVLFFGFALKFFFDSFRSEDKEEIGDLSPLMLLGLAVATSLDALISGLSLSTYPNKLLASLIVGVVTFVLCFIGHQLSTTFAHLSKVWFLRLAGLIFLVLAYDVYRPFL